MTTLTVDTFDDGTNTISTPDLVSGTPKAWNYYDGTGPVFIRNSFAVSSLVDISTGIQTTNLSTVMASADFAIPADAGNRDGFAFPGSTEANSTTAGKPDSSTAFTITTGNNNINDPQSFASVSGVAIA